MTKIGFVGLGRMGGSMATRLMDAGYAVYGTARNRASVESLIDQGLDWRDTARQVAETTEVLITSLPDDNALLAVSSGPNGALAGLGPGKIWIDTSTVSPLVAKGLASRVHRHGVAMLAAPVSGSVPQVQSGTLAIMVGGSREAFERVEPTLRQLGTPRYVGDNDQALILKLAINVSLGVQAIAFAEGLLLALGSGIDAELALDVLTGSAIGSPMLKARGPLMLDSAGEAWFDIDFMKKDMELALEAAAELPVPLPSASRADELLAMATKRGYGSRDIAALFDVLRGLALDDGMAA